MLLRRRAGDSDVHGADRLFRRTAARAGDAGDAQAVRRADALADAARERDGHGLGNFAVLADQRGIDAGDARFERGGVADAAAEEVLRAAGDVGDARRHLATGARLGDGQRRVALSQQCTNHAFERVIVEAVNALAEKGYELVLGRGELAPRRRLVAVGGDVQLRLTGGGENGQRLLVAMRVVVRLDLLLHHRLAKADDLDHAPEPRASAERR